MGLGMRTVRDFPPSRVGMYCVAMGISYSFNIRAIT